ncbi:glycoside hydrolase family 16 protein [Cohnella silvisoli]|uniref:Glycoside hydrolase family 16 protein n=1 Tax=Cohnella silvisoli TaxID=2873699 RepID=A0ABV1KTQ7_9BACL|nr:glycoside hydrolase family 16 protein [Cohnella silvisoli]MCD9022645.1 glycoside hydrolase family 16 protein [Cohnella silvisoli]
MMSKSRALLSFVLMLVLTLPMALQSVAAADFPANPPAKSGYTLDFQEEFDGSALDTSKWLDYYLPHWTSTRENAKARYTIADGVLTERLEADTPAWNAQYDGTVKISSIQTYEKDWWHKFNGSMPNDHHEPDFNGYSTKYGYFEIRAKQSNVGGGGHQAWWMVGTGDTSSNSANSEIDIVETFFSKPQTWRIAAYGWGDPNFLSSWVGFEDPVPSGTPSEEYHIYAMDWTPTSLKFYYDNQLYKTINAAPQMNMGMILGIYTDAGSGVHNNVWPKTWNVDYLRVWKKDGGYSVPFYRIKNRQTGQYMHIQNKTGKVEYGNVPASYWSSQWTKESVSGGYIRYKNRWTGEYMHTENLNGNVQYSNVAATAWRSQWTEENVSGYIRLKNRDTGLYMHTEQLTGFVQYGTVPSTYWTSQWTFEAASN